MDGDQAHAILGRLGAQGATIRTGVDAFIRDCRALWPRLVKNANMDLIADQIAGIVDDIVSDEDDLRWLS